MTSLKDLSRRLTGGEGLCNTVGNYSSKYELCLEGGARSTQEFQPQLNGCHGR